MAELKIGGNDVSKIYYKDKDVSGNGYTVLKTLFEGSDISSSNINPTQLDPYELFAGKGALITFADMRSPDIDKIVGKELSIMSMSLFGKEKKLFVPNWAFYPNINLTPPLVFLHDSTYWHNNPVITNDDEYKYIVPTTNVSAPSITINASESGIFWKSKGDVRFNSVEFYNSKMEKVFGKSVELNTNIPFPSISKIELV